MRTLYLLIPFAPLAGSLIAGLGGRYLSRTLAHWVTTVGVAVATVASFLVLLETLSGKTFNGALYTWAVIGELKLEIGFLIDPLTATMALVVSFVSLMVHIYTIGYMADDPGYKRFFAYISLFTFSMLMLVMSNNFLQLFFGWEAVGLVSYLLIGFWWKRPTATYAALKAFLVNRVGDFGFILGIGLIYAFVGSLDYATVFQAAPKLAQLTVPGTDWALVTAICIFLFIGAMGKSAQFPLHVWLPDSMEGPTPISALIHAATMVTAGIFMVARMSPLFELSDTALSVVIVIGAITAFFMGLLGIVQNDIKRVVAYSTLSQLGYMAVALGASAYSVAIFHLVTHAFFKALLFLAAGSVIIAMHHEQDIRRMGGLWRFMPVTWLTALLGTLALVGTPFFSGFYSKDSILIAVQAAYRAGQPGATFAYYAVLAGVFVTAFYSFRMFFLVFHGPPRFKRHADHGHDAQHAEAHGHGVHEHAGAVPQESPAVVTVPLMLLAIPSVVIGYVAIERFLFSDFLAQAVYVDSAAHPAMKALAAEFHGPLAMALHGFVTLPFFLALAGAATAAVFYLLRPDIPAWFARTFAPIYRLLDNKYYMDRINELVFAAGARRLGWGLWQGGDVRAIDGVAVNGSARLVGWFAGVIRYLQSGYIYHYAFSMLIGIAIVLFLFVTWPYLWPTLAR